MRALRYWSVRHAKGLKCIYDTGAWLAPKFRGLLQAVGRSRAERFLLPIERCIKQTFFDCKMCGKCELSSTGMACPTNCAKRMRNGPCGGVRPNGNCEVLPDMRCVWVEALQGRKRINGQKSLSYERIMPIDHSQAGTSTWVHVIEGETAKPAKEQTASLPREIHDFEKACRSDRFVVTIELGPPDSADPSKFLERAKRFKELTEAINITDGAGGNCHMSSMAASAILTGHGFTTVYQVACRDRNRIAIQGDLLGAAALDVKNVLCLTGDDVSHGDQPQAKPVFDLDSVSLLAIAREMRDRGEFASGRKLETAPNLFLGATINPFAPPYLERVANLKTKIEAGAQFIQTQFCFDVGLFSDFMHEVRANGLHEQAAIIVGLGTLGSAKALARMAANIPGVHIPQKIIDRVANASDQKSEAQRILIETIQSLSAIEGVAGVHLMGHRNDEILAEAIVKSGIRGTKRSVSTRKGETE